MCCIYWLIQYLTAYAANTTTMSFKVPIVWGTKWHKLVSTSDAACHKCSIHHASRHICSKHIKVLLVCCIYWLMQWPTAYAANTTTTMSFKVPIMWGTKWHNLVSTSDAACHKCSTHHGSHCTSRLLAKAWQCAP